MAHSDDCIHYPGMLVLRWKTSLTLLTLWQRFLGPSPDVEAYFLGILWRVPLYPGGPVLRDGFSEGARRGLWILVLSRRCAALRKGLNVSIQFGP